MRYRPGRVHSLTLVALAAVGVGFLSIAEATRTPAPQKYYGMKMSAVEATQQAIERIGARRLGISGPVSVENDPSETGLIGHEWSPITSDEAAREEKISALDPDLAGVFVQLLKEAGVGEGDLVALAYTGDFPVMNAAALISVEKVGAVPVPIASVAATSWGANDPRMTWLDMEEFLLEGASEEERIISHRSIAASRGGSDDSGLGSNGNALIDEAIERNGVTPITEDTLEESIVRRMEIYDDAAAGRTYACYFNVGGGTASLGSEYLTEGLKPGLKARLVPGNFEQRGALVRMGLRGVPVIHVPRADEFIDKYGLDAEQGALEELGTGELFEVERYHAPLAGVLGVLYAFIIFAVVRIDIKHYLFRRPSAS